MTVPTPQPPGPVPPPTVTVQLLDRVLVEGPSGVTEDDALAGPQAGVTLALLTLERGRPVPADRLADALWDTEPPATWRPALRSIVARVREAVRSTVPGGAVDAAAAGYVLELPGRVSVDLERAREAAKRAERTLDRREPTAAIRHATTAVELGGRSFLPRAGSGWARRMRDEMRIVQLRGLHVIGEVHLLRAEPERAARTADEAIRLAPLNETSHRLAMRSLAAAGERAEAAAAYDRCRRLLSDQLGVVPSRRTSDLFTAILRD